MSVSPPVLVHGGAYGDLLAGALKTAAPHEDFVSCATDGAVPGEATVLVTMLDDDDAVRRLLTPSVTWVHVLAAGVDRFPFDA
ncbi:MAG: hypothetical protein ABSG81_08035, partial [Acidimicrobiales bacterium]